MKETTPHSPNSFAVPDIEQWQTTHKSRIDAVLARAIPEAQPGNAANLLAAMRYASNGGKRLRALLVYAAACLHAPTNTTHADLADAPAAAVELIHAYSLVHDDLPCMDDDDLRRGQPSCHVRFGEAMALLAGDALQSLAFKILAQSALPDPASACALLADAAGALGMAGGQALDMEAASTTVSDDAISALATMHQAKTGALIRAAILLGASCGVAHPEAVRTLEQFGDRIGLAFQIADDILDVVAESQTLGKTAGKDAAQQKATYVTLLGVDEARRRMLVLHEEAIAALEPLGKPAQWLAALATQIVMRSK